MNASHFSRSLVFGALLASQVVAAEEAPIPQLPPAEQALIDRFSKLSNDLKVEITKDLPPIDEKSLGKYKAARKALEEAQAEVNAAHKEFKILAGAEGLVHHARHKWIAGAHNKITALEEQLKETTGASEQAKIKKEILHQMDVKQKGVNKLRERRLALDEARRQHPPREKRFNAAKEDFRQAEANAMAVVNSIDLAAILESSELDSKLAKYAVLSHAQPPKLAKFAAESKDNEKLIEQLLSDEELLVEMAVADGARNGLYGNAMKIYTSILSEDPACTGHLRRLALGIALEHAKPIKQRNPQNQEASTVDPIKRYFHYKKAEEDGELDPGFATYSAWEYRFLVAGDEPDEIYQWGRDMLRNYRPDLLILGEERWRYVHLVRSEIAWSGLEYGNDREDLQLMQNILMNGGTCGRRALFGRFMLRAFGIPTIPRPQKGHASLLRWTSKGWRPCLGGNWGSGWTKSPYGRDVNFHASTEARALGKPFMQVMRAYWIGTVMGEKKTWGLARGRPEFWNGIALYTQRKLLDARGEKPEEPFSDEGDPRPEKPYSRSKEDRMVSMDPKGVITVPAVATTNIGKDDPKVLFMASPLGGGQLHYKRNGKPINLSYEFNVPKGGTYRVTANVVTPSWSQNLELDANGEEKATIELPHTIGKWQQTKPVEIVLKEGVNFLTVSHFSDGIAPKGFTVKDFTLTPK